MNLDMWKDTEMNLLKDELNRRIQSADRMLSKITEEYIEGNILKMLSTESLERELERRKDVIT